MEELVRTLAPSTMLAPVIQAGRRAGSFVLAVALGLSTAQAQFYTVDDDGPADFSDLQVAVDSLFDSAVIYVMPGDYGNVTVDKYLSLLGREVGGQRPHLDSLYVRNTIYTRLTTLDVDRLTLENLSSRCDVQDLRTTERCVINNVAQVFASRCEFDHSGWSSIFQGPSGVELIADSDFESYAYFTECVLRGGTGWPFDLDSGVGGNGLFVQNATAYVSGCQLEGGQGVDGAFSDGLPGAGLRLYNAHADVRGRSTDLIVGASQGGTFGPQQAPAVDLVLANGSSATLSGVTPIGPLDAGVQVTEPRAWIHTKPNGTKVDLEIYGPAGDLAFWFVGNTPGFDTSLTPLYGQPLTVLFPSIFATGILPLNGPETPVVQQFFAPTALPFNGTITPVQVATVNLATGVATLTNGADVLL